MSSKALRRNRNETGVENVGVEGKRGCAYFPLKELASDISWKATRKEYCI